VLSYLRNKSAASADPSPPLLGLDLKAGAIYTAFTALGEFFYHTNVRTPRWGRIHLPNVRKCTAFITNTAATKTTTAISSGRTCSSARATKVDSRPLLNLQSRASMRIQRFPIAGETPARLELRWERTTAHVFLQLRFVGHARGAGPADRARIEKWHRLALGFRPPADCYLSDIRSP
jgi:hypothetical protein